MVGESLCPGGSARVQTLIPSPGASGGHVESQALSVITQLRRLNVVVVCFVATGELWPLNDSLRALMSARNHKTSHKSPGLIGF